MLVYANRLRVQGSDAERPVFKAIGGWLKEQLGFGLHPDQLQRDGDYRGRRGEQPSRLRIHACYEGDPALCAWVLKHTDDMVRGRQWIVEVGVKKSSGTLEVSCVVKTDEGSALVDDPVIASQPRVVRYIVQNVLSTTGAALAEAIPGEILRTVGKDRDSYLAFLPEIERRDRDAAIVLVSPTPEGEYLLDPTWLQNTLLGLANVVQVLPGSNTYEMEAILGRSRSAWNGAVNLLAIPSQSGLVRCRIFLSDEILAWGEETQRVSQVLARVTANTNILRLRTHVRPEGVMQLAMRRRMDKMLATSTQMHDAELRNALAEASEQAAEQERILKAEQERIFREFAEENETLHNEGSGYRDQLEDARDELRQLKFQHQSLTDGLARADGATIGTFDPEPLIELLAQKDDPSPLKCLQIIKLYYSDRCTVLDSAHASARKMTLFIHGRDLLGLLWKLVTTYRDRLMDGGDTKARGVFGRGQYAAKESELVMANKDLRRKRTFEYDGMQVEMFRHLKIGVSEDPRKTIRVHFHWDAARRKIVIGYCGEHLPVSSH